MSAVDIRSEPDATAAVWADRPDISARSVLVTVLGDTVVGLGGEIWLGDLFSLTRPFGFSERLIRTSLSRLAADGWVMSERDGRRSRYRLTDYARRESAAAESRIYRPTAVTEAPTEAEWLLVFSSDDTVATHLRWRGFAETAPGVFGRPATDPGQLVELFVRIDVEEPPMAEARFLDATRLSETPYFRSVSGLDRAEAAYTDFVDRHGGYSSRPASSEDLDGPAAFAERTMLVHDLRRCRLAQPDVPPEVLPDDWIGHQAHALAAERYRTVSPAAWKWVASVTGTPIDTSIDTRRFSPLAARTTDRHPPRSTPSRITESP